MEQANTPALDDSIAILINFFSWFQLAREVQVAASELDIVRVSKADDTQKSTSDTCFACFPHNFSDKGFVDILTQLGDSSPRRNLPRHVVLAPLYWYCRAHREFHYESSIAVAALDKDGGLRLDPKCCALFCPYDSFFRVVMELQKVAIATWNNIRQDSVRCRHHSLACSWIEPFKSIYLHARVGV